MSQSEEREEGLPPSKTTLSGEHDSQTKAKSPVQQERPDSPEPSCVSMKSDWSMDPPIKFKRQHSSETKIQQERPDSPEPSCVSMKSDWSRDLPHYFKDGHHSAERRVRCDFHEGDKAKGENYLRQVSDAVSKHRHMKVPLKKPFGSKWTIGQLADTIYKGNDAIVEEWANFYLPNTVNMVVLGAVENSSCQCGQFVLMTCEDKNVYAYDGEELHVVASSLKQLDKLGFEYPGSESFWRGQPFKNMSEDDWAEVRKGAVGKRLDQEHLELVRAEKSTFMDCLDAIACTPKDSRVHHQRKEVPTGQSPHEHQTDLDSIFMLLEENIVTFVNTELKRFQKVLSPDYPECLERQREDEEVVDGEEEEQRRSSREAFLEITLHFLRRMKQEELADFLQSSVGSTMSQSEERNEGLPPSKTTLSGEHDSQTKAKSPVQQERPDSPEPSCVSMKRRDSKDFLVDSKDEQHSAELRVHQQRKEVPSGQSAQEHQTDLDSIFMFLEENIVTFVKNELKRIQRVLSPDYPECSEKQREDEEVVDGEEEEQRRSSREAFLQITLHFLRRMKQEELADFLQSKTLPPICQHQLKSDLKEKFQCVFEGIAKAGNPTLLNQIYTELYITEGGSGEVNDEHEVRQIETASRNQRPETTIKCKDIFKPLPGRDEPTRTVMTMGVAGIGKTVLTQKFTLDWAEDKANQDIQFIFPFTFRELNLLKKKKYSFVELLHHFFIETKEAGICRFDKFQVVFIFDGLHECRLPLDFQNNEILTDVTESTSVDVLLTNLIKGKLLPSARLWITTRPAAANQIPPECVDMVTEVRGFTDPQKEEYFRKRFRDEDQARRIISHIKTSRSLHIMCHIPLFCWITATVLEHVLKTSERGDLPKTLTEMYIHFLVVQSKQGNVKYHGRAETDPHLNPESRKMILSLGKLAFEQLEKGNLIFYEADLTECDIDIRAASVYSGVFTQIFKEERGLYQDKVFCFVHLSIQEFLAAVYVIVSFIDSGVMLLSEPLSTSTASKPRDKSQVNQLYQSAVDKALQSPNGHLDLFLRFLLGLSLETNQILLRGLLTQTGSSSQTNQETVQYIQEKIRENPSPERSINLFHCLNELNDRSLVEEIQQYLRSGSLSTDELSPAQWSALVFILLSSEEELDVFHLKKYSASEEALLRLLPVVKASNKSVLSGCNLSARSCEALASVLSSQSSSLREMDLSNNDLQDSGVKLLSAGLESPHCRLDTLRLSGCLLTEEGCASLASALSSNPSHLRELDLSYNHPGASGVKLLSAGLEDPHWRLDSLSVDHGGVQRLKPGLRKYACELTLDPNTAHRRLFLSEDNRKVTWVSEEQPYPDHPERFEDWTQLLCRNGLTGRCYWEVEREGHVDIGVTYRGIRRGRGEDYSIGRNEKSWCLDCSDVSYSAWHNNRSTDIPSPSSSGSNRVAVYLDWPAGSLSFYRVSSDTLSHIHTFHSTFTEPLYPGFGLWSGLGSSVSFVR
ncbi:NACHT, LRR and PYD domains-containing protein 3-like isoform X3 [Centroberyx affinis]|uniref:NACHT, LRR and PYD domains-containing protein 3-like isoform X3 n=1 Tax=Centroberyx affinis TaxID=166261 RepID=UPI003A5BE3F4